MNKYKKGIIHLLPLVLVGGLIVAVIGGMVYFSNNSDTPLITKQQETKNEALIDDPMVTNTQLPDITWGKYGNNEYNFQIEYPANLLSVNTGTNKAYANDTANPDLIVGFHSFDSSETNLYSISIYFIDEPYEELASRFTDASPNKEIRFENLQEIENNTFYMEKSRTLINYYQCSFLVTTESRALNSEELAFYKDIYKKMLKSLETLRSFAGHPTDCD